MNKSAKERKTIGEALANELCVDEVALAVVLWIVLRVSVRGTTSDGGVRLVWL